MKSAFAVALVLLSIQVSPAPQTVTRKRDPEAQRNAVHLGSAPLDALVGIEVTNTASDGSVKVKRWGNGFVLRCDGFILAPIDLFSGSITVNGQSETAGKQTVTVFVNPGRPNQIRIPAAAPRFHGRDVRYGVLRLHNFHSPAVKTLLPDVLSANSTVELVYSALDPATGNPLPAARLSAKAAKAPVEGSDEARAGKREFSESVANIPIGAVVTGPDGMAVGLITSTEKASTAEGFSTFTVLHKATNCVTAAALPDSDPGPKEDSPSVRFSPMVPVPGGPTLVSAAIDLNQPDLEGEPFVCVAPFQIDQFEVTNEEYYAYWKTIPDRDKKSLGTRMYHYPLTWAPWPDDPPFPWDIARLPVLGVPLPGAMAFAKWRGKRLPTPYEWSMAAFGNRGDALMPQWATNYISERNTAWTRIKNLHMEYLRSHTELHPAGILLNSAAKLPWIARTEFSNYATAWSKQCIDNVQSNLWGMWKDPNYILPVGSREFDISPSGAMDMILNASELVMPSPTLPALGAARYMEIAWIRPKPDPQDPWAPRVPEALTDGRPLQPLSRLYRRALIGPTAEEIVMWSNINEVVEMLGPLSGWQLRMTGDAKASASMWQTGRSPYEQFGRPAGFQLYSQMPPHFRKEMGHPIPLDAPERAGPGPQLFYYLPTGFRCAR